MKQCEIVAIVNGKKSQVQKAVTECHHMLSRADAINGFTRQFTAFDDDGPKLSPETKVLQVRAGEQIQRAMNAWEDMINLVGTQDVGNQTAVANVVVDGNVILENVPATHLLYLEKQAVDMRTFIANLPVLDPAEEWAYDDAASAWRSKPIVTIKTSKEEIPIVLYEATDKFPAQTQLITKDVPVGNWTVTKFSGAIEASERTARLARVDKFITAVKQARERANQTEVQPSDFGTKTVQFLFG